MNRTFMMISNDLYKIMFYSAIITGMTQIEHVSMGMYLPSVKTIQDVQILGEKIATSGYNCGF